MRWIDDDVCMHLIGAQIYGVAANSSAKKDRHLPQPRPPRDLDSRVSAAFYCRATWVIVARAWVILSDLNAILSRNH